MGILSWIFHSSKHSPKRSDRGSSPVVASELPEIELYSVTSDRSYFINQDVVTSLEFSVTLDIRTPLEVLIHHGETFEGPPSAAPRYGTWGDGISPDGVWAFKTKSWAQLARESGGDAEAASKLDDMPEGLHASDIGPTLDHVYLPFLIEFRKIIESKDSITSQIKSIRALKNLSPEFSQIYNKLGKTYPGFPDSFFISKLCIIPGIGPKVASNLFRAGFLSVSELKNVELGRLTSVPGVGPGIAKKIQAFADTIDSPERSNP
jgi:hypothetical protein